jgi:hypothetical protein
MNTIMKIVLAGGLACAAGVAAAASAATASAAPVASRQTVISFTQHETSDHNFNLGSGHGIAVGLIQLAADNDYQGSRQIGHDGGSCTMTRLSGGTADELCNVTFALTRGQIDAAGLVTSTPSGPGTFTIAITGGTGAYAGARGQATVVPARSPKITLRLGG